MELTRQEQIREKGFDIIGGNPTEYGKIKVGVKTLDDATLNLGAIKNANRNLADKRIILKALAEQDVKTLREISDYFYRTSGIY